MDKFDTHTGIACPLMRINIDTDAIIPSKRMRSVSKKGLGPSAFFNWRYNADGSNRDDFPLNFVEYKDTSILVSGRNFGCGSSREHAAWALLEFGIKVIVAPSFGTIFYKNCIRNGILPAPLDEQSTEQLAEEIQNSDDKTCTINLPDKSISTSNSAYEFAIQDSDQELLMAGLDPINQTLQALPKIEDFISQDRDRRAWAHLD